LHICAIRDSASVASVLLEASASIDALCDPPEDDEPGAEDDQKADEPMSGTAGCKIPSKQGIRTALHLAAYHDSAEVAQLLIEKRASVSCCVKGAAGALTPLHECASSDAARVARILAPLAAAAADASNKELEKLLTASHMDLDDTLDQGERPESPDAEDDAVVQWSRFLDPLQAKVGHNGSTPLHTAAENDAAGVVAALLDAKADPALGDDQGDTPVHCAMLYGSPRALDALLAHGASPSLENGSGELPLHFAAEFGPGGDDDDLPPALTRRHFARSIRAQEQLVECLRARDLLSAALAHRAFNDVGNTPLHAVARWDHAGAQNAAKLLASSRADLELVNEEGRTALSISTRRYGRTGQVATLLRSLGAQEQSPGQQEDLAGALGGYARPLVPQQGAAACPGTSGAMEVDAAADRGEQPALPILGTQ